MLLIQNGQTEKFITTPIEDGSSRRGTDFYNTKRLKTWNIVVKTIFCKGILIWSLPEQFLYSWVFFQKAQFLQFYNCLKYKTHPGFIKHLVFLIWIKLLWFLFLILKAEQRNPTFTLSLNKCCMFKGLCGAQHMFCWVSEDVVFFIHFFQLFCQQKAVCLLNFQELE